MDNKGVHKRNGERFDIIWTYPWIGLIHGESVKPIHCIFQPFPNKTQNNPKRYVPSQSMLINIQVTEKLTLINNRCDFRRLVRQQFLRDDVQLFIFWQLSIIIALLSIVLLQRYPSKHRVIVFESVRGLVQRLKILHVWTWWYWHIFRALFLIEWRFYQNLL